MPADITPFLFGFATTHEHVQIGQDSTCDNDTEEEDEREEEKKDDGEVGRLTRLW